MVVNHLKISMLQEKPLEARTFQLASLNHRQHMENHTGNSSSCT